QARQRNSEVHLVGPRECAAAASAMGVTFTRYALFNQTISAFRSSFGTPRTDLVRWFVLHAYMTRTNLSHALYLSLDVLLFANATEAINQVDPSAGFPHSAIPLSSSPPVTLLLSPPPRPNHPPVSPFPPPHPSPSPLPQLYLPHERHMLLPQSFPGTRPPRRTPSPPRTPIEAHTAGWSREGLADFLRFVRVFVAQGVLGGGEETAAERLKNPVS
ncbi:unnamed protein product, partial [Closterium sp. NIES-53]